MELTIYSQKQIHDTLYSLWIAERQQTFMTREYREGYETALVAMAAAFGIVSKEVQHGVDSDSRRGGAALRPGDVLAGRASRAAG